METSYDRVPYAALSFPRQSPARIGAVALMYGIQPPPPGSSRILELGCGHGFTTLALAQLYPGSEFVGIDLSSKQIANAKDLASASGITNATFESRSILDISKEKDGAFDYITCHGVFSWVPDEVKEKILQICGEQLTARGIAYVSFNAYPGWSHLRAVREMLIYHTARFDDPLEKFEKAKAFIGFLRDNAPGGATGWQHHFFTFVAQIIERADPAYFLHEFLEDQNDPMYFHEFMSRADRQGLQFLSEAHFPTSIPSSLGPNAGKMVEFLRRSVVDAEQYMDFIRHTQFRQTLLCRKEVVIERSLKNLPMKQLVYASAPRAASPTVDLKQGEAEKFTFSNGANYSTSDSVSKAVLLLFATRPGIFMGLSAVYDGALGLLKSNSIPVPPHAEVQGMANVAQILGQLVAAGFVEISLPDLGSYVAVHGIPKKPFSTPLARQQARTGWPVTRSDLQSLKLRPEIAAIVAMCDGEKTHNDLFRTYVAMVRAGELPTPVPRKPDQPADLKGAFVEILRELSNASVFWIDPNQVPAREDASHSRDEKPRAVREVDVPGDDFIIRAN